MYLLLTDPWHLFMVYFFRVIARFMRTEDTKDDSLR